MQSIKILGVSFIVLFFITLISVRLTTGYEVSGKDNIRSNLDNAQGVKDPSRVSKDLLSALAGDIPAPTTARLPLSVDGATPIKLEAPKPSIEKYIQSRFGQNTLTAECIVAHENPNYNPLALHYNKNGSVDTGIFQINSDHGYSIVYLQNWKNNIDVAFKISGGYDFLPWTTYSFCH